MDALEVFAWDVHEVGHASTRADEDPREAFLLELLHGDILPDIGAGDEVHAQLAELLQLVLDDAIGQDELGDSVAQDASELFGGMGCASSLGRPSRAERSVGGGALGLLSLAYREAPSRSIGRMRDLQSCIKVYTI